MTTRRQRRDLKLLIQYNFESADSSLCSMSILFVAAGKSNCILWASCYWLWQLCFRSETDKWVSKFTCRIDTEAAQRFAEEIRYLFRDAGGWRKSMHYIKIQQPHRDLMIPTIGAECYSATRHHWPTVASGMPGSKQQWPIVACWSGAFASCMLHLRALFRQTYTDMFSAFWHEMHALGIIPEIRWP
jgi:hypothetical protein